MKNQYVCDIGDYGKYSMLNAFLEDGVKVGINWYFTDNDKTNDGKFKEYLSNEDDICKYDPVIFESLKKLYSEGRNNITEIKNSGILPDAVFYPEKLLPEKNNNGFDRAKWFQKSIDQLSDAELIFADPDNGLLANNNTSKAKYEKYVLFDEVMKYYNGHNVVFYCHKGRRTYEKWLLYKSMLGDELTDARTIVLTYHKGTQRSYIFLIHEEQYYRYRKIIEKLLDQWNGVFTEEFTSRGTIAKCQIIEQQTVDCSDGTKITMPKNSNDWKKIYDDEGNLIYEGFTINGKAFGMGISYYKSGVPFKEGLFGLKGFIQGKEYYPSGQIRCYAFYMVNKGYGPNIPTYVTWYSEEGKMIYQGSCRVKRSGLGWPTVETPKEYSIVEFKEENETLYTTYFEGYKRLKDV